MLMGRFGMRFLALIAVLNVSTANRMREQALLETIASQADFAQAEDQIGGALDSLTAQATIHEASAAAPRAAEAAEGGGGDEIQEEVSHMLDLSNLPELIQKLTPPYQALAEKMLIDPSTGLPWAPDANRTAHIKAHPQVSHGVDVPEVSDEEEDEAANLKSYLPSRSGIKRFLKTAFVAGILLTSAMSGMAPASANETGLARINATGPGGLAHINATSPGHSNQFAISQAIAQNWGDKAAIYDMPNDLTTYPDKMNGWAQWYDAVDHLPVPSLSMINADYTQLVSSAVSASSNVDTAMQSAEVLLEAIADEPPPLTEGRKYGDDHGITSPCEGASCYTDPDAPPPQEGEKGGWWSSSNVVDKWSAKDVKFKPGSWKRAGEWSRQWKSLAQKKSPLLDGASAVDVRQGGLGDCWFMAGIASAAEKDISILDDIFLTKNHNPEGYYKLRLWIAGEWVEVVVDDYLPGTAERKGSREGGVLARSNPQHKGKLWVSLLEKAYAKVFGGYGALENGYGTVGITDVNGKPSQYINFVDNPNVAEIKDWAEFALQGGKPRFLEKNFREAMESKIKSHNFGAVRAYNPSATKIVKQLMKGAVATVGANGHQWSILDTKIVDDEVFLKIRNPWGQTDVYDGAWSDKDPVWKTAEGKQIRAKLGGLAVDETDGTWWMRWDAFRAWANNMSISRDSELIESARLRVSDQKHDSRNGTRWKAHRAETFKVTPSRPGETLTIAVANPQNPTNPQAALDGARLWARMEGKNPDGSRWNMVQKVNRQTHTSESHYLYLQIENAPAGEISVEIDSFFPGIGKDDTIQVSAYLTRGAQIDQIKALRANLEGIAAMNSVLTDMDMMGY